MNTMELVRMVERAQPRSTSSRESAPLFPTELIGPVRHAILRARQLLVSEQRENGSWLGAQTCDASLPSQLVLLLAYLGEEQTELAQQAAAAILKQQLPGGGWSLAPGMRPDVSTSVLAYFALKLTGVEANDERLGRARCVVRRLGGADAADSITRFFLALLGQVDYDCCPAVPPEWPFFRGFPPRWWVPLSIIWSHRPVRDVGVERGVRELFVNKPREWPRLPNDWADSRRWRISALVRSVVESVLRQCERRGWTPLRRRALERAEAELLRQVDSNRIDQFEFFELLWHTIAIRTLGHSDASPQVRWCDERLRTMICTDRDCERAWPRLRAAPITDTSVVLRALIATGVSLDHPAATRALNWLLDSRRRDSSIEAADLTNFVAALAARDRGLDEYDALPPSIEISREDWAVAEETQFNAQPCCRDEHLADLLYEQLLAQLRKRPNVAALEAAATAHGADASEQIHRVAAQLRAEQCADGSWDNEADPARIHATSLAIRGLAAAGVPGDDQAIAGGINWLVVHQQPGGGWGEAVTALSAQGFGDTGVAQDVEAAGSCRATASHTAFALLALVAGGKANHPAARHAVQFLVDTQEDDGRWHEPHFVARDAATGRWCGNELHSVAWPLLALSRWAVAVTAAQQDAGDSIALRLVSVPVGN